MIGQKMKYLFILFTSPVLCQYAMENVMKPDVTFGEHNDRFDLTSFVRRQEKLFKNQNRLDRQSEEYRRRGDENESWLDMFSTKRDRKKMRKALIKKIEDHANELANTLITKIRSMRRFDGDFAHHDDMISDGTAAQDYEKNITDLGIDNLKESVESSRRLQDIVHRLHGQETRRTMMDPENEILVHYALPINMKIEGFLQAPVNEK